MEPVSRESQASNFQVLINEGRRSAVCVKLRNHLSAIFYRLSVTFSVSTNSPSLNASLLPAASPASSAARKTSDAERKVELRRESDAKRRVESIQESETKSDAAGSNSDAERSVESRKESETKSDAAGSNSDSKGSVQSGQEEDEKSIAAGSNSNGVGIANLREGVDVLSHRGAKFANSQVVKGVEAARAQAKKAVSSVTQKLPGSIADPANTSANTSLGAGEAVAIAVSKKGIEQGRRIVAQTSHQVLDGAESVQNAGTIVSSLGKS